MKPNWYDFRTSWVFEGELCSPIFDMLDFLRNFKISAKQQEGQ